MDMGPRAGLRRQRTALSPGKPCRRVGPFSGAEADHRMTPCLNRDCRIMAGFEILEKRPNSGC